MQMAWELDFWGRFRRAIEAADAELDASVENYDDVLVILLSDVASTYVEIRTLEERLRFARDNVKYQTGSLNLAKIRLEEGAASKLDVTQAQTNVSQTEAAIPVLETVPPVVASPNTWVSRSSSRQRTPPSARTVRRCGSTRMPFIGDMSITRPPLLVP